MTKRVLISIVLAMIMMVFTSCTNKNSSSNYDIPTYEDNKEIMIGVWNGSHHDLTDMELYNLQEAGVNLLVGDFVQRTSLVDFIDRCAEFNINIIPDQRPWNGEVPSFINRENFLGFCVYDEPNLGNLQALKKMSQSYAEAMQGKLFFINLNPSGSPSLGADYITYVTTFVEECNLPMVSYDRYALVSDSDEGNDEVYVRENYLYEFDVCSYVAREHNIPLWYSLLTAGHLRYTNPTVKELEWQMYLAMTFGSNCLIHYIYSTHDQSYHDPIVDMNGNPTDTYYKVKEADATIRSWDHIYMNYNWLGYSAVDGTTGSTSMFDYISHNDELNAFGTIVSATSEKDIVIGHFEDGNQNAGIMITNLTAPYVDESTKVDIEFESKYTGALVIVDGEESIYDLKKGKLSIDVESGRGVFIIPLKTK